ncbi:purine and uridine phosphorylase [Aspergillus heteromorphus CBS 117.55]|uniref:Purine and uridine phosphorylase n=1 Tax=Aspergillus heteromorphus CBS 117.55 TaxID=1448321 RepID=A0A317WEQ8_9EURO|nr:purine and uridine phosphorylase [Aspergillus heteromorphus CBS 117.55]PWY84883.1 purine and uridine phosphorylase [Aspergillus heteromorphus CBS 117.55]
MSPQKQLSHDAYTVGWICIIDCELNAALALLDEEHELLDSDLNDNNLYYLGRCGKHNVVVTFPVTYGANATACAVTDLVRTFTKIRFGLMVGVAGAVPGLPHPVDPGQDVRLGDVVVGVSDGGHAGGILNYDTGKWETENELSIEPHLNSPPSILLNAIKTVRTDHQSHNGQMAPYIERALAQLSDLADIDDPTFPGWESDRLFKAEYQHFHADRECSDCDPAQTITRLARSSSSPVVHYGLIASGNAVMRNAPLRDRLRDTWNVLCFEMEAAGLVEHFHFPCLVIRGLCDYSDSHKSKRWQAYAAVVAAAYAKDLLRVVGSIDMMEDGMVSADILVDGL